MSNTNKKDLQGKKSLNIRVEKDNQEAITATARLNNMTQGEFIVSLFDKFSGTKATTKDIERFKKEDELKRLETLERKMQQAERVILSNEIAKRKAELIQMKNENKDFQKNIAQLTIDSYKDEYEALTQKLTQQETSTTRKTSVKKEAK